MKLLRARFTVRRLMIGILLLALLMGGADLWRRRVKRLNLAAYHDYQESALLRSSLSYMVRASDAALSGQKDVHSLNYRKADWTARMAEYHKRLSEKYEQASRAPWRQIAPDPPRPQP